jgi:hypothetical protein
MRGTQHLMSGALQIVGTMVVAEDVNDIGSGCGMSHFSGVPPGWRKPPSILIIGESVWVVAALLVASRFDFISYLLYSP